jgi:hypothetical protein
MGFRSKLFGGSSSANVGNTAVQSSADSKTVGVERALRFAKQPRPKYSHSKKEAVESALVSLERAVLSIDGAHTLLKETQSLLQTVLEDPDTIDEGKRSVIVAQISIMQERLISYIEAATVNDLNLIDGHGAQVVIALSESTTGQLVIRRVNLTPQGMGIAELDQGFDTVQSYKDALLLIERAIDYVSTQNETFCANATILASHYGRL